MTVTTPLDPVFVRAQIDALRVAYPQIENEEDQWLLTLESETDVVELLTVAVDRLQDARALINGIGQRISELKVRQDRFDQRCEAMRSLAFKVMTWAEVKKLELAEATLSIRAGQPKVIITDEAALPIDCVRIKREPDKAAIKEHFARGDSVPGAELSNAEPTLAVRIK
jgi:hypothetical protein